MVASIHDRALLPMLPTTLALRHLGRSINAAGGLEELRNCLFRVLTSRIRVQVGSGKDRHVSG